MQTLICISGRTHTVDLQCFDTPQFGRFFLTTSRRNFVFIFLPTTNLAKILVLGKKIKTKFWAEMVQKKSPKFDPISKNDDFQSLEKLNRSDFWVWREASRDVALWRPEQIKRNYVWGVTFLTKSDRKITTNVRFRISYWALRFFVPDQIRDPLSRAIRSI